MWPLACSFVGVCRRNMSSELAGTMYHYAISCALTLCVLPGPAVACAGTRATGCRPGSLGSRDRTLPLPPGLDRWTGTTCGTHGPARTLPPHALRSSTRSSTSICSEECLCIRHPKPSIQLNCPCIWICMTCSIFGAGTLTLTVTTARSICRRPAPSRPLRIQSASGASS
jgi:hypothetical protein